MANAKEQFGLSERPEIHGVIERENLEAVAADDYSAQIEMELNRKKVEKREKATNKKLEAYALTIRGNTRNGEKMETYSVDIVIPKCEDESMQYHSQRFVVAELVKQGKLYDGVLTRSIDEISNTTIDVTFIGKDVFELSKDEIQLACDYYGISGCAYTNPSIRSLQREFYKKYILKTDQSLNDKLTRAEFITKVDSIIDYKKLPKIVLGE